MLLKKLVLLLCTATSINAMEIPQSAEQISIKKRLELLELVNDLPAEIRLRIYAYFFTFKPTLQKNIAKLKKQLRCFVQSIFTYDRILENETHVAQLLERLFNEFMEWFIQDCSRRFPAREDMGKLMTEFFIRLTLADHCPKYLHEAVQSQPNIAKKFLDFAVCRGNTHFIIQLLRAGVSPHDLLHDYRLPAPFRYYAGDPLLFIPLKLLADNHKDAEKIFHLFLTFIEKPQECSNDAGGNSLLHVICRRRLLNGNHEDLLFRKTIIELLLTRGFELNSKNSEGLPALFIAIQWKAIPLAKFLIERGAEIAFVSCYSGNTLLHYMANCACEAHEGMLTDLMEDILKKLPIDIPNKEGDTPLIKAVKFRKFHRVILLLKAGADYNITNQLQESAFILLNAMRENSELRLSDIASALFEEIFELMPNA